MAEIGSAFVTIVPSARGFGSTLNRQVTPGVTSSGRSLGRTFGKMFILGASVLAAAGIGSLLKGSIEEAREAQKVGAQTGAVLKSTGGIANVSAEQIDRLAASLSAKIGVDDEAIQAGENMLLTFTKVRNEAGKGNDIFTQATRTVQDMAAAFGGDATSNSKQLGKALNDPVKGVQALTRVGVQFTDQQKEQIKKMVESGNILGAQKVILKEVGEQTRGSAEAQATAGDKARVAFDNLKEQIGTALLPVMDRLANFFTTKIAPAISGFITDLQNGTGGAGRFGSFLRNDVLPVLQDLGHFIMDTVVPAFKEGLSRALEGGRQAFNKVKKAVQDNKPELQQIFNAVKKVATVFYERVIPAVYAFAGMALKRLGTAIGIAIDVVGFMVRAFNGARDVFNKVRDVVGNLIGKFGEFASAVRQKVGNAISTVKEVPGKVKKALSNAATLLVEAGKNIIKGLISGIKAMAKAAADAAVAVVKGAIDKAKGFLHIKSPSKLTEEMGRNVGEGLARGIESTTKRVGEATEKLTKKVKEKVDDLKEKLKGFKSDFASLVDPIASAFTGSLFESETASGFVSSLLGTKGQLTGLIAAFKTLIGQGLNPKFLYDLFQSGNAGLILDLAKNPALAAQAGGLFGDINQLSTELGQAVAGATPDGKAITASIEKTNNKLDKLIKSGQENADRIAEAVTQPAKRARRRAVLAA